MRCFEKWGYKIEKKNFNTKIDKNKIKLRVCMQMLLLEFFIFLFYICKRIDFLYFISMSQP